MKKYHFYCFALFFLFCQFATLFACAQANNTVIRVTLPGNKVFLCISADSQIGKNSNAKGVLTVVKASDSFDAQLSNLKAVLPSVTIDYYTASSSGQQTLNQRVILRNAQISQFSSANKQDQIQFLYTQLAFTYFPSGTVNSADDWEAAAN